MRTSAKYMPIPKNSAAPTTIYVYVFSSCGLVQLIFENSLFISASEVAKDLPFSFTCVTGELVGLVIC
jgi:hypothetical protein